MSHFKTIQGKGIDNLPNDDQDTTPIQFKIPDNSSVSGLGMPITMALCRKIVSDYHDLQNGIFNELSRSASSPELTKIIDSVSPDKEVVSGIYGRDTLMHILEQEGCEGVRYINCIYGGKKSIVLLGVDKYGIPLGGVGKFSY